MSFPLPPDQPQSSAPHEDIYEPDPDDADTGPLRVPASPPPPDSEWDAGVAAGTWAGRFDAPLTVSPRPVHTPRNPNLVLGALGAIVAVAAIGALVFWLVRSSSADTDEPSAQPATSAAPETPSDDEQKLLALLPAGYPADTCEPIPASKGALAQVKCDRNSDNGGPLSATYTLAGDKQALDAAFNESMRTAQRVNCPGNIQSPGPWRRNASPDKIAGTLFCGLREGQPTVMWTDDAQLIVNAVQSGPQGPTFPQLYAWWASHS